MPVDFDFLAVKPRGYGRSYFVVQSGHGMRLPQGGRGCNDRRGPWRVWHGHLRSRMLLATVRTEGAHKIDSPPARVAQFPKNNGLPRMVDVNASVLRRSL